jgi:hypothetical protein
MASGVALELDSLTSVKIVGNSMVEDWWWWLHLATKDSLDKITMISCWERGREVL